MASVVSNLLEIVHFALLAWIIEEFACVYQVIHPQLKQSSQVRNSGGVVQQGMVIESVLCKITSPTSNL